MLLLLLGALAITGCDSDQDAAATATTEQATTAGDDPPASEEAPSTPVVPPVPARVPGYEVSVIGPDSYRLSQVFRLRNAILNGLSGGASSYDLDTVEARRQGVPALLIGVAAAPGAQVSDLPTQVNGLIGASGGTRTSACGRTLTVYRAPGDSLAVAAIGPRRALIAMAERPEDARRLAAAATRAVVTPCNG